MKMLRGQAYKEEKMPSKRRYRTLAALLLDGFDF
jgi:hypothetical protein